VLYALHKPFLTFQGSLHAPSTRACTITRTPLSCPPYHRPPPLSSNPLAPIESGQGDALDNEDGYGTRRQFAGVIAANAIGDGGAQKGFRERKNTKGEVTGVAIVRRLAICERVCVCARGMCIGVTTVPLASLHSPV
jgi:hypothetical protein